MTYCTAGCHLQLREKLETLIYFLGLWWSLMHNFIHCWPAGTPLHHPTSNLSPSNVKCQVSPLAHFLSFLSSLFSCCPVTQPSASSLWLYSVLTSGFLSFSWREPINLSVYLDFSGVPFGIVLLALSGQTKSASNFSKLFQELTFSSVYCTSY